MNQILISILWHWLVLALVLISKLNYTTTKLLGQFVKVLDGLKIQNSVFNRVGKSESAS